MATVCACSFRTKCSKSDEYNGAFLIVDGAGLVHRMASDAFQGTVNFNDPRMAKELTRQFEEMWPTAVPDANLRRAHL